MADELLKNPEPVRVATAARFDSVTVGIHFEIVDADGNVIGMKNMDLFVGDVDKPIPATLKTTLVAAAKALARYLDVIN